MLALNDALDDLGNLRVRVDIFHVNLHLSPAEAKVCIDEFINLLGTMVVPDIFTTSVDVSLLYAIPNIVDSPYVKIDPGIRVMYYNALYYGLQQTRGPGGPLVQAAYMKVLEAVPAWLESSTQTEVDGHTAALTAWTAINNQDYQLSWKFHCKSCQFIKVKGIDQLDTVPAKTFEEESERDTLRFLYWQIISTDIMFRLFYGKPTVVSAHCHGVIVSFKSLRSARNSPTCFKFSMSRFLRSMLMSHTESDLGPMVTKQSQGTSPISCQ